MRKLTIQQFQDRLDVIHPNQSLIAVEWNGGDYDCMVKCGLCGQTYVKRGLYFLDKRKVSICKNCFPTQPNQLKTDWQPPEDYELVSEYKGMSHKVFIRHKKCGFIWGITPSNLKQGKGCPKCNKVMSKGEQVIKRWLEKNNIKYIWQYPLNVNERHYKIDFYLPDLDLYIEYNGEQHYMPVNFFGGEERLKMQQLRDEEVKKILQDKLLVISYLDFENIESILESSTTNIGYKRLIAKAEDSFNKDDDIVSTSDESQSSS